MEDVREGTLTYLVYVRSAFFNQSFALTPLPV